jgi:peroxiredoxin
MMILNVRRRSVVLAGLLLGGGLTPAGAQAPGSIPLTPAMGDVIPAFETLGVDGKPAKVDFPKGSKTVLLFFLSGCPHCHEMIPEWNKAFERKPIGLRILGVIMDPDQAPASFWKDHPIAFPVVRSPGREFVRSLNVNRVPLTLRVGESGRVEDLGLGVLCQGVGPLANCLDASRFAALFAPAR